MDIIDLLELVEKKGGSDLVLNVGEPPRIRVRGELDWLGSEKLTDNEVHNMIYTLLTDDQKARFEEKLQLDFRCEIPNVAIFRINISHTNKGISGFFRRISTKIPSLMDLKLLELTRFAELERGLVIVTGPTGCGKSTTLAAIIEHINQTKKKHILTLEDPIEFVYTSKRCTITQREVNRDVHTFADGLSSGLRQNPEIILVGEMRDPETTSLTVTAAETGHLIFTTLHTRDAPGAITRIIDTFPSGQQEQVRSQLSMSIEGVIFQKLIPVADEKDGYNGRRCVCEIMGANSAIRNLIERGKIEQIYTYIQSGKKDGMITLEQSLIDLVRREIISKKNGQKNANKEDIFNQLLGAW